MLTRALLAIALICGAAAMASAQETKVVALGLAHGPVDQEALQGGEIPPVPKFNTPGVAYALVAHANKGDTIEVRLVKDGGALMREVRELEGDEAGVLVQSGKSGVPVGGWPEGLYSARVKITRDGQTIAEQETDPIPFD